LKLSIEEKEALTKLLNEKDKRVRENKLLHFKPYPFQKKFYKAGKDNSHRLLMAANRVGKSYSGAMEVAYHLTGLYPSWWRGRVYKRPIKAIGGGVNTERVRDIIQKELLGEPSDPNAIGTGAIPKSSIVNVVRRAGIPNAISIIVVKHKNGGNSKITLQSYESGKEAWMGDSANLVWLDEEPPEQIYSQALRAMVDVDGDLMMTFTPENGVTNIVRQYTQEIGSHQYLQNATWEDAPHITKKVKDEMFASMPAHERDMRMRGLPMVGSGLVFSVPEENITVDDFQVPSHWRRISGIDFGYDHPTAWASLAYDAEADIVYVIQALKIRRTIITEIASVLKKKGANRIPVAWPHDGLKHDTTSGHTIRDLYEQEGVRMLFDKFTNPPSIGAMEGSGGIGIEAGIAFILDRMETGRFKVFKTCGDWFNEFRMYHRKNGKIVDKNDDIMAATRYATLSLRFAINLNINDDADEIQKRMLEEDYFQDSVIAY